jgi:hypothetical protein
MKEFRSEIKTRGGRVENVRQAWVRDSPRLRSHGS